VLLEREADEQERVLPGHQAGKQHPVIGVVLAGGRRIGQAKRPRMGRARYLSLQRGRQTTTVRTNPRGHAESFAFAVCA
jgi:hypothetical protein